MGTEDVEKFVSTPELYSEDSIGTDPLPPGQVGAISPGAIDENPGLFRIDVTEGPGSGVRAAGFLLLGMRQIAKGTIGLTFSIIDRSEELQ
jgi:hypothetical protein